MFIDTYLCASDCETLKKFCDTFSNAIAPHSGRPAEDERIDEEGLHIPAKPALGDPAKFYACIRSSQPFALWEGIEECDAALGVLIVGTWG